MLTPIRSLILLIHFLPFVLIAQSQKVEIDQEHIAANSSFTAFLLKPIRQDIDYLPEHRVYLAKMKRGHSRLSFPGQLLRQLDHDLAIIALSEAPLERIGDLSFLSPVNDYWKLSPPLLRKLKEGQSGVARFVIRVENLRLFKGLLRTK